MANDFWTSANVDPKRKYRFLVELAGTGGESLWFAKTVDKPEITIGTGEVDFMQHKFYYPGRVEWNEIGLTLVDPVSPDATGILLDILQASGYTGPMEAKTTLQSISKGAEANVLGNVVIKQVSADGTIQEKWTLNNAIITKVGWGDLDYSSEDLSEISISFRYDWASCEIPAQQRQFLK
tara:strand:+ start:155 stop:694 length:540 start_codon:yes stop_codon:yes gene_type:complete